MWVDSYYSSFHRYPAVHVQEVMQPVLSFLLSQAKLLDLNTSMHASECLELSNFGFKGTMNTVLLFGHTY